MTRHLREVLARAAPDLLGDALGLAALCLMLLVALNLPGAI